MVAQHGLTEHQNQKIQTSEIKFLRRVKGCTQLYKIKNDDIRPDLDIYNINWKLNKRLQHLDRMDDGQTSFTIHSNW